MEPVALLAEAARAGLQVRAERGRLVVRGPRAAEALAREILDRKADVMAWLAKQYANTSAPRPAEAATLIPFDDDGRRVWISAMGALIGWPRLPLGIGMAIAESEPAWRAFTAARANADLVDRAVEVLLAVDTKAAIPLSRVEMKPTSTAGRSSAYQTWVCTGWGRISPDPGVTHTIRGIECPVCGRFCELSSSQTVVPPSVQAEGCRVALPPVSRAADNTFRSPECCKDAHGVPLSPSLTTKEAAPP